MTTTKGFGQDRTSLEFHGPGTGGKRREARSQAKLSGLHTVVREIGVGTNDPAKAIHVLRETSGAAVMVERIETGDGAGAFQGRKARGTEASRAAVASGDDLLSITGVAYVGATNGYENAARIVYEVDGSVSDAAVGAPGRMTFSVSTGSGSSLSEKMRITSTGKVGIGMNNPSTKLTVEGAVTMKEQSSADSDTAAYGQVWVKTATPNELYFTTDAGDDIQITSGTSLAAVGMTSFQLEDGDGTEVAISNAKEVKFVEGQGIDINWTDTDNGTDGDPYDLTFTVDLEGTELASTGESGGSKFLREDGDGTCSWQTVSVTGMSSFFLEDGDGTEVEITNSKEVKFVEGQGIDIDWTDVSTGSDADPYDLTFTCNLEGTELASTGETGGSKFLREDGDGTCSWQSISVTGMSSFFLEDGDGTEVEINNAKEVKFVEGGGIDINWTDTSTGSDGDPYDLTFTVADTTVDGDSGSTGITPGDTLTIAGGTNVTTAMSGDTLTITSTDTNTMGSGFVLEDGDGTEVTVTENKEVKFVEGGGIDIDWTDTDNGTDADPYDLTFTVSDTTVAGDSGSTGITPGDTLTIAGGTNVTTAMSGDTLTVNATDTNTMGSGFVLEDGDGTEVTITENKEVKIVEGTGIDVNWTDVSPGSDADPYDLTISCDLEGTELKSTGETGGSKFLREDGDGTCSWQTVSGSGSMSSFFLEDGDGTEVEIGDAKEVKFIEGGGIDINWTDTSTGSDADPYDLTFTVADTTVAGDTGSTGITPGDTLTIAGGTNVTTAMSGDTLTITSTDTNTMGSGFVLEDGDGTEVTVTENNEVKFVEGTGIDINWTDTSPGSDADPYDLTFTVDLEGTELKSTGETGGSKFLREDGDGTCSWQTVSGGGSGDVEAGSTFTTAGVIMACNGDDKTIDEPGATLTTNDQAMTVSSPVQTSFAVDCGNRDGNGIWTFTTGTGDSGSAQDNQGVVKVIAQTSANASLFLGDTASDTKGGLKYKNNGDSMQLLANGNAVLELDSSKVVEFKIAAASKTPSGTGSFDGMSVEITPSKWLQVKIDGVVYWLPAFLSSQFS